MGGEAGQNREPKRICLGLLAHVDAGKTTLSEALLYQGGAIRRMGRVDKGDTFLDTSPLERQRGITIFSKQAQLQTERCAITLLDTPGHVDFSAEMERTLQVLDYAVLVINGADGVQAHTETLWNLLRRYRIPVFLFVNKMDQEGTDREGLLSELQKRLSPNCLDFTRLWEETAAQREAGRWDAFPGAFCEAAAMCDEALLERYLETERLSEEEIGGLIRERKLFPCYFGSALKLTGLEALFFGFDHYMQEPKRLPSFGAKVFKIARDPQGKRLSYMKITGGSLSVKMRIGEEKVDQIRLYSGDSFESLQQAEPGMVCAVLGLENTEAGQGLGAEPDSERPVLEPVFSYRIVLPEGTDPHEAFLKLRTLSEEEPELGIFWNEGLSEIEAKLMGEIQTEILRQRIKERFGIAVDFSEGHIVYKETITKPAVGIGHFEPLRHYAEVHLLLEPLPRGSGIQVSSACGEEMLSLNWQRLILELLAEGEHPGVLCGAPVTDMGIRLIAGRSHPKHTEGGDFRQAAFRALRQGLMQAESALLEPYYDLTLELPKEYLGRALSDLQQMDAEFSAPEQTGETAVIRGSAPASRLQGYQRELLSYTRGRGRLSLVYKGYGPCLNQEEIIAAAGYDPEQDAEHPAGSIFCAHGAGYGVGWREVPEHAHIQGTDAVLRQGESRQEETGAESERRAGSPGSSYDGSYAADKELEEIFQRTFGSRKQEEKRKPGRGLFDRPEAPDRGTEKGGRGTDRRQEQLPEPRENWLLVDGYNVIHAWEELKALAAVSFDAARTKLLDILSNYQGYRRCRVLVVFDAYKVAGRYQAEVETYHNIFVVYTKQAETADQYIARAVQEIGKEYNVTVATSDRLVQLIILGQGALRLSARELLEEVEAANQEMRCQYLDRTGKRKNELLGDALRSLEEKKEEQQETCPENEQEKKG